jgi:hypothetical protein
MPRLQRVDAGDEHHQQIEAALAHLDRQAGGAIDRCRQRLGAATLAEAVLRLCPGYADMASGNESTPHAAIVAAPVRAARRARAHATIMGAA